MGNFTLVIGLSLHILEGYSYGFLSYCKQSIVDDDGHVSVTYRVGP